MSTCCLVMHNMQEWKNKNKVQIGGVFQYSYKSVSVIVPLLISLITLIKQKPQLEEIQRFNS